MLRKLALVVAALPLVAGAKDFNIVVPNQPDFREVSEDIVATLDYKALGPAEAGGLTGFSIGVLGSYVAVDNKGAWKRLTGENVSELGLVGVRVTKGLPFNLDVGAFYSSVPTTDVTAMGGEVRYAILPGSVALPALALRGSYSTLSGIRDFDVESKSMDVSVSKGFALLTPYAGAGYVWGESDPNGSFGLRKEKIEEPKFFAGLKIGIGLFELTPEYTQIGDNNAYNVQLGLGF